MTERSINDIAASLRAIRLYLEPVNIISPSDTTTAPNVSLGVPIYDGIPNPATDKAPGWFRVLGPQEALDCKSSIFIYANLPPLIPSPVCELDNTGYLDFPANVPISFVEFTWGEDVLRQQRRGSQLSIDNHTLSDLWLVWEGDANSTDKVPHGHTSKHGGGSVFGANFLITVFHNDNGSRGSRIGPLAMNVIGADVGELVVRGDFLYFLTATTAIKIGLWIIGSEGCQPRESEPF